MGVPLHHLRGFFCYKLSSYWSTPMLGNPTVFSNDCGGLADWPLPGTHTGRPSHQAVNILWGLGGGPKVTHMTITVR
jgi:hypothetical protein